MKTAVGLLSVVLIVAFLLNGCSDRHDSHAAPASRSSNAITVEQALADPGVKEVASEFACPCGGCDHDQLLDCRCDMPNGAVETISTIYTRLEAGDSVSEAVDYLASRFPQARREPSGLNLMRSSSDSND
jgi:hypothetical protein